VLKFVEAGLYVQATAFLGLAGILVRRETADQTVAIWQAGPVILVKRQKFSILPVKHDGDSLAALSGRDFYFVS